VKKMKTKAAKTTVLVSLLALAALAVIFLPTYAGDLEPTAQLAPKFHRVYEAEPVIGDLIIKATPEEECGETTATGSSESFSFDEAFVNAVRNLPEDTTDDYPDKMTAVRVVEIYATYGGITGGAYLYVTVQRVADPACLRRSKMEQEAEPGVEGKIRRPRGELRKLPDPKVKFGEVTKPKPIEEK
jgi:hypothetical protein